MGLPPHWIRALIRLGLWLVAAVAVGAWFGMAWPALAFAIAAAHFWLCLRLVRMEDRLRSGRIDWNDDDDIVDRFGARFLRWRRAERRARRRLLKALRNFRDAAGALPDAVLVLDDFEQVLWFNQAAQRLLAVNGPRDFGKQLGALVPATSVLAWYRGRPFDEPLMDVASPVDPALRLSFRVVSYRDRLRLLIVREITWLLRLEQMRKDFVANVSHELRTPLTVVNGYLDTIEDDELPEYAPVMQQMRSQARRMAQIVDDLLLLSRLDAQERAPLEPVGVAAILRQLLQDALALSGGQHEITLCLGSRRRLLGSAQHLFSAFANLVTNAVRYTPPGGRIEIACVDAEDGSMRVSVSDTGQGIPAEHLHRLTERFYRVSVSRSRDKGGTGLGLAIVKHVLQLHEGRLTIESELGKGSCFTCVLPRERVGEVEAEAAVDPA